MGLFFRQSVATIWPVCFSMRILLSFWLAVMIFLPVPALALPKAARADVAFTAECEDMIINAVARAKREVLVAIFTFSNRNIASALVKARKRGVDIRVKVDVDQMNLDSTRFVLDMLRSGGIAIEAIEMSGNYHMHHKFMVIDRQVVLTGSYNYTVAASTVNYENIVMIFSDAVARSFIGEFESISGR